jgi:hypothetical protein
MMICPTEMRPAQSINLLPRCFLPNTSFSAGGKVTRIAGKNMMDAQKVLRAQRLSGILGEREDSVYSKVQVL